ncbi:MAG TPA: hypothetical protein VF657_07345 [Actinoplanes sp.]|jgi:hypothetical protein
MSLVLGLGAQSIMAHADENGLVEEAGMLSVETQGVGSGIENQRVDFENLERNFGMVIDFQDILSTFPNAAPFVTATEAEFTTQLTNVLHNFNEYTGYKLDIPAENERFVAEVKATLAAADAYTQSPPAPADPRVEPLREILASTMPIVDGGAPCRDRCLVDGNGRMIIMNSVLIAISSAFTLSDATDETKNRVTASLALLGMTITAMHYTYETIKRMSPEQRARFTVTGFFSAAVNALRMVVTAFGVGLASNLPTETADPVVEMTRITNEVATAIVTGVTAAGGTPPAETAINIHDEL